MAGEPRYRGDQLTTALKKAAALRCAGRSWACVAEELGRTPSTVRCWPAKHPEIWQSVQAEAQDMAESMMLEKLNKLITEFANSVDPKERLEAAKMLNWRYVKLYEARVKMQYLYDRRMEAQEAKEGNAKSNKVIEIPVFLGGWNGNGKRDKSSDG